MCYLFDVIPTLGALSGVTGPKTSEGLDLSATLRNPTTPARTSLMFAYQKVQRSLRDERYKLIRYPLVDRTQLFDLVADPDERTDLSVRPEHTARITAMTAALGAEMKRLDDPAELTVASPRPSAWSPPPARGKK
jgi:arylsulfatase A-like enzyme